MWGIGHAFESLDANEQTCCPEYISLPLLPPMEMRFECCDGHTIDEWWKISASTEQRDMNVIRYLINPVTGQQTKFNEATPKTLWLTGWLAGCRTISFIDISLPRIRTKRPTQQRWASKLYEMFFFLLSFVVGKWHILARSQKLGFVHVNVKEWQNSEYSMSLVLCKSSYNIFLDAKPKLPWRLGTTQCKWGEGWKCGKKKNE